MELKSKLLLLTAYVILMGILFFGCTKTITTTPSCPYFPRTNTPTPTITATPTVTSTPIPPCDSGSSPECAPMTVINFHGNLSSTQRADQPGGVLTVITSSGDPVLPFFNGGQPLNGAFAQWYVWWNGTSIQLASVDVNLGYDFSQLEAEPPACPHHLMPVMMGSIPLEMARARGVTTYVWNQLPSLPPTCSVTKTLIDSLGNSRQITFHFYQVNDLGTADPPINAGAPIPHVIYAWYAFETTDGQQPSNSNLVGGTGISEGFSGDPCSEEQARGILPGSLFWGDFLIFNSDGSLASEGSVDHETQGQTKPYLYIPANGLGKLQVELNFGTAGMLGYGQRDGITSDAAPSNVY